MSQYYTFIQKVWNESDELYTPYFTMATAYVTGVIWLTNSLLLVLVTCFIEKQIDPPKKSLVGSFIDIITKEKLHELTDLLPDLRLVGKTVNLIKHSLIGIPTHPDDPSIYFWDLGAKQHVVLSPDEQEANLSHLRKTLAIAKLKLSELQNKKSA